MKEKRHGGDVYKTHPDWREWCTKKEKKRHGKQKVRGCGQE